MILVAVYKRIFRLFILMPFGSFSFSAITLAPMKGRDVFFRILAFHCSDSDRIHYNYDGYYVQLNIDIQWADIKPDTSGFVRCEQSKPDYYNPQ